MEELSQIEKNKIAIKLQATVFSMKESALELDLACDDSFVANNMRNTVRIINSKIEDLTKEKYIDNII